MNGLFLLKQKYNSLKTSEAEVLVEDIPNSNALVVRMRVAKISALIRGNEVIT